jgi:hypothetical protein
MKTIAQQLNIKEFPFIIRGSMGNVIYYENSKGFWYKREYDSNGNEIYYEDSDGIVIDKRLKQVELTLDEIANKFGVNVSELKIKK